MPINDPRNKVLFLPTTRFPGAARLTKPVKARMRKAAAALEVSAIFPQDEQYTDGAICSDRDVSAYWRVWKHELADIKALIVCSGDFMAERAIQDTVRLLPADVPLFLMVSNDIPGEQGCGDDGDSLCGSLSASHNLRMLGRRFVRICRIDMRDDQCVRDFLRDYLRIVDGIECLRHLRLAMIGVNPNSFATTFTNQPKLFELGFSLQTYELMTMWGDVVLGRQVPSGTHTYQGDFGEVTLWRPIARDDARVPATVAQIKALIAELPVDDKVELMARAFLWLHDVFEEDMIDAGAIHCWSEMPRFFGMTPCTYAMLANLLLRKPVVCEQDLCHAAMAKLAWGLTGEAGVILDLNNNGWDPRVFNVFHCSQTPTNWLKGPAKVGDRGTIEGVMAPVAFTGIAAATSADDCRATVFHGQILNQSPAIRGTSGWAFVSNLPQVLKCIEATGIHHFVAVKGHLGNAVTDVLSFRGLNVENLAVPLDSLAEIEAELTGLDPGDPAQYRVYSE
jgi:L-fucose isomerase-like protein